MSGVWHFTIEQGGIVVAAGEGPRADVEREALHYAAQYVCDDEIIMMISPGPLPEPAP